MPYVPRLLTSMELITSLASACLASGVLTFIPSFASASAFASTSGAAGRNVNHLLLRHLYVFFVVKSQRLRLFSPIMAIFAPFTTYNNPLTHEIFLDFNARFFLLDKLTVQPIR